MKVLRFQIRVIYYATALSSNRLWALICLSSSEQTITLIEAALTNTLTLGVKYYENPTTKQRKHYRIGCDGLYHRTFDSPPKAHVQQRLFKSQLPSGVGYMHVAEIGANLLSLLLCHAKKRSYLIYHFALHMRPPRL